MSALRDTPAADDDEVRPHQVLEVAVVALQALAPTPRSSSPSRVLAELAVTVSASTPSISR